MTSNIKIKTGQTWVSKKDGRLIYIGKKHDSVRWNTTNSVSSRTVHAMSERSIKKHYRLVQNDSKFITQSLSDEEVGDKPVIVKKYIINEIKTKPWYIPQFIYSWLVRSIIVKREKVAKVK